MPLLSLVTCTRDPHPDLLRRVLVAVEALRVPAGWDREYVLVDSASAHPLAMRAEEQVFLTRVPWARIVRADVPGLSVARRLGLRESRGDLLAWFDDDNVPDRDYLLHLVCTAESRPEAGVWGAGTIAVEFTGPVAPWVERTMRPFFQERAHGRDEFGRATTWAPFFPVGSGLVTRRAAMERWAEATTSGRYSLTGRHGATLSAGDDAQIILGAVAAGEEVGVVAAQRLVHLIPPSRCTADYLARLEFGLSASLRIARAECFPDDPAPRRTDDLGSVAALRAALAALRTHGLPSGTRLARLELARRLGALAGTLQTTHRPEPWWLRAAISSLALR